MYQAQSINTPHKHNGSQITILHEINILIINLVAPEFKAAFDMFDTDGGGDISTKEYGGSVYLLMTYGIIQSSR